MTVAILALLAALLIAGWPYRLSFFLLTLLQLVLWIIGLSALVPTGEATNATVNFALLGICAFIAGYIVVTRLSTWSQPNLPSERRGLSRPALWAVVLVVTIFTAYHFSVTGLPILSSSIETDRFDFSSSGFFGIPGRMYLYGTTDAFILASADATIRGTRWLSSGPWRLACATLVASSAASGFKGQFLAIAILVFGTHTVVHAKGLGLLQFARRFWWIPAIAVVYFFGVANLYTTYQEVDQPLSEQLLDRATSVGAEPAALVLTKQLEFQLPNPEINDFTYFVREYTGQSIDGLFSFERLVSTSILGFSPLSSSSAPPVTVGALAEITYAFGGPAGLLTLATAGALLARADCRVFRTTMGAAGAAIFSSVLTTWILKGDLAYQSINNVAVLGLLLVVALAGWLCAGKGQFLEPVVFPNLEPAISGLGGERALLGEPTTRASSSPL